MPFLGALFTQESSKTVSRNLAIFLRPTIVSNQSQRAKVLEAWRADLGDKLFSYEDNQLRSRDPIPIGKRLVLEPLRPKARNLGKN